MPAQLIQVKTRNVLPTVSVALNDLAAGAPQGTWAEGGQVSCLVTALFYDSDDLERAIDALIAKGVPLSDLSLMLSRSTAGKYFAPDEGDEGMDGPRAGLTANLVASAS